MLYPIAIEAGDDNHAYCVVIPDLNGCFAAGDTREEAIENAKKGAKLHVEDLLEQGEPLPRTKGLSTWQTQEQYKGWTWDIIEIN